MANKYIGETAGKYWKQKNDETYVNEEELVKITDLEESDSVEDDDLLIKGNPSTGKMLKIKIANFLDGIKEKLLGSTDISSVGDGTVTGAISENADDIAKNKEDTDTAIDELNSALAQNVTTTGTDLNNYTTRGLYYFSGSYTPTNIPAGSNGWLQVFTDLTSDGTVKQLWFRQGTPGTNDYQTYVRTYSSGAWGDWERYITESDVPFILTGYVSISVSANSYTDATITFSTSVPSRISDFRVLANIASDSTSLNYGNTQLLISNRSRTGCTIRLINNSSSSYNPSIFWAVVGS